jgi:hypothetical protein
MALDDLRGLTEEDDDLLTADDDEDPFAAEAADERDSLFLGMTPIERMFISIFLFMNVAVLGVALLLATGRIG